MSLIVVRTWLESIDDSTRPMTSPRPEHPDDIKACHALIEQLQAELHATKDQIAKLQSAAADAQDAEVGSSISAAFYPGWPRSFRLLQKTR
jgi:hypothetical protein